MTEHCETEALLLDQRLKDFNDADLEDSVSVFTSKPFTSSLQKPWFHRFLLTRTALPGGLGVSMLVGAVSFPHDVDDRIDSLTRFLGGPVPATDVEEFLVLAPVWMMHLFFLAFVFWSTLIVCIMITTAITARMGHTTLAYRIFTMAPSLAACMFASAAAFECAVLGFLKSLCWWWLMAFAATVVYSLMKREELFMPLMAVLGASCCFIGSYPFILGYPTKVSYFNWFWWVFGGSSLILVGGAYFWAWWAQHTSERLIRADTQAYDSVWAVVSERDRAEIAQINEEAATAKKNLPPPELFCRQHTQSLDGIYAQAQAINDDFQDWVAIVAAEAGGTSCRLQPKKVLRAMQKTRRVYKNDAARLCDVVRSSIIFQTPRDLRQGMEHVLGTCDVRRIKHRFAPDYQSWETAGYRDLMMNIAWKCTDGTTHICELQLHLKEMHVLMKAGGHARYVQWRDRRGG